MVAPCLLATGLLTAAPPTAQEPLVYSLAKDAVAQKQVLKTDLHGWTAKKTIFEDCPPQGAVLIGFDLGLGDFLKTEHIYAVRPLYLVAGHGEVSYRDYGEFAPPNLPKEMAAKYKVKRVVQVKAKPGYAVGAVTLRTGIHLNGMAINFMRIKGSQLDPDDSYNSGWYGDHQSGKEKTVGGSGSPVVGVFGNEHENQVTALGLMFVNPSFAASHASGHAPGLVKTRAGRPDELQGPLGAAPTTLGERTKLPPAPKKIELAKKDAPAEVPPEEEAYAEEGMDLSWVPLIIFGLIAVPAVGFGALFILKRKRKERVPPTPSRVPGRNSLHYENVYSSIRNNIPMDLEDTPGQSAGVGEQPNWGFRIGDED